MKDIACIVIYLFGGALCLIADRPDLVGLGMIILAGLLRIAFGIDDRRIDELNKRLDKLKVHE